MGFGFKSSVTLIHFNKTAYLKALDEEMLATTVEAATKWLNVVTILIPNWSRASLSTFQKLADSVGYSLTIGPSIAFLGDRSSEGKNSSDGGLIQEDGKSWHFFYKTDLSWLVWNEFNRATKGDGSGVISRLRNPGPYRFQEIGRSEFESFAKEVRLPNPIEFISGKKI